MLYFLRDFKFPFLLAALLGLFLGWLLWRWRRRNIDGSHYEQLVMAQREHESELSVMTNQRDLAREDLKGQTQYIRSLEHEVSQLGELRVKADALRVDYHEAVAARTHIETNLAASEQARSQLELNFEASEKARTQLAASFQASETRRTQLTTELKESEHAREELAASRDWSENARSELLTEFQASEQARAKLQGNLQESEEELDELQEQLDESEKAREQLKARVAASEKARAALQVDLEAAEAEQARLETELTVAEEAQAALQADFDINAGRLEELESDADGELAELRTKVATATSNLAAREQEAAKLQAAISELENDLVVTRQKIAELEGQLTAAESERVELEGAHAEATNLAKVLQGQLGTANGRVTQIEADAAVAAETSAGRIQSLQGDYDASSAQAESLQGQLGSATTKVAELEGQAIESARAAAEQRAALENQLGSAAAKIDELEEQNRAIAGLRSQLETTTKAQRDAEATVADLDAKLSAAAQTAAEQRASLQDQLGIATTRVGELEGQAVESARAAAAQQESLQGQLVTATAKIDELESQNRAIAGLRSQLETTAKAQRDVEANVADLQAELATARQFERRLTKATTSLTTSEAALDASKTRVSELNSDVRSGKARIKELEKLLAAATAGPIYAMSLGDLGAGDWHNGTTKLGTPGADHTDDLTLINGIGPKIEDQLNGLGIRSWEQLAALSKKDVETVDAALEDFPGRIERDHWVAQARHFIKNGREPVALVIKPVVSTEPVRSLAELDKGRWHKGTTKLGTPGAAHKDDLKEINGIGPKIEDQLNGLGIRSWEQLAALSKKDVETVDAALEDFPGRIERDQWVAQARHFIKNGHEPVELPRKDRAGRTIITEWTKGTTKLGTPGAAHKDDLKVVNGIGPKMESILNGFGITSWEQLAALSRGDIATVTKAIHTFPGRIERDQWVGQAQNLVRRFRLTSPYHRPTRETFLNDSGDEDPWT